MTERHFHTRSHAPLKVQFPALEWTAEDELALLKRLFVDELKRVVSFETTHPDWAETHKRVAEEVRKKIDALQYQIDADHASELLGDEATTTRIDDLADTLEKVNETYHQLGEVYGNLTDAFDELAETISPERSLSGVKPIESSHE